jgi:hypothetical protein
MNFKKCSLVILSVFLILLVFVSSASAADSNGTDVLSIDESASTVNEELALDYSSGISAESNDTNVIENDENNLLSADSNGNTWYVDGSKTSSGDGKSEATAFITLEEAINNAESSDAIMIASGTYTGSNNVGLEIKKNNITLMKYGDGEAIFDAEGNGEILKIFRVPNVKYYWFDF